MSRQRELLAGLVLVLLSAGPLLAAAPPGRPLAMTSTQFQALRQVEQQPEHAAVRQVHATYQSERERHLEEQRTVDDITSGATFAGWIGALVTILICAAPL